MRLVGFEEASENRVVYINPEHVISIFRGPEDTTMIKVVDGKVYKVVEALTFVRKELTECS